MSNKNHKAPKSVDKDVITNEVIDEITDKEEKTKDIQNETIVKEDKSLETAIVQASLLNVRTEPYVDAKIVKTVSKDTELKGVLHNPRWFEVHENGEIIGYTMSQYIDIK